MWSSYGFGFFHGHLLFLVERLGLITYMNKYISNYIGVMKEGYSVFSKHRPLLVVVAGFPVN